MSSFAAAAAAVRPFDERAAVSARERHDRLTKPVGALGRLETLGIRVCGIVGLCPAPVPRRPHALLFAADHGVVASGVTPWPQEVTAQMVATICAGRAASSVMARQVGAEIRVVDVGVAHDLAAHPLLVSRRVRAGSRDLSMEAALTVDEVAVALDVGAEVVDSCIRAGADLIAVGEMGIGNTTPSAAVISALLDVPAVACTGRGTGIDDAMLAHKCAIVDAAVARIRSVQDPRVVLAEVGGFEIAAIAGCIAAAAAARVPVIIDGVITLAALLVADALVPGVASLVIAAHRPVERGGRLVLDRLGLDPVLDLGLRLGEGTGALLAIPLVQCAVAVLSEMATLDEALGQG